RALPFDILQITFAIELSAIIEDIVFTRDIENVLGPAALQHLVKGVELFRLRQLCDIPRMNKERGRSGHRVDAIESNLEGLSHIFVRFFVEPDMAIADLQKTKVGSWKWRPTLRDLRKSFGH